MKGYALSILQLRDLKWLLDDAYEEELPLATEAEPPPLAALERSLLRSSRTAATCKSEGSVRGEERVQFEPVARCGAARLPFWG